VQWSVAEVVNNSTGKVLIHYQELLEDCEQSNQLSEASGGVTTAQPMDLKYDIMGLKPSTKYAIWLMWVEKNLEIFPAHPSEVVQATTVSCYLHMSLGMYYKAADDH
jgi:hypothetical protein